MHSGLVAFVRSVPAAVLVNGTTSRAPSAPATLLMASDSLGNSLIASKPGLTGERRETFNVDFAAIYELAVDTFVRSGDCEKIVVRMNAEGVEGPIIEFLASARIKPDVLAGSLGDIKKCFGQDAYEAAMQLLDDAGIPFVYLTSNVGSWASGLSGIMEILASEQPFVLEEPGTSRSSDGARRSH